jgi:hypothetical protein
MGGKLGCHFVGHRKKAEKSLCSSSPSCPLDTACDLLGEVTEPALVPALSILFQSMSRGDRGAEPVTGMGGLRSETVHFAQRDVGTIDRAFQGFDECRPVCLPNSGFM